MQSTTEVHPSQTQTPPPHTKTGSLQPNFPAILRLPREIIIHILSSLPRIKHLPSVLLSHRIFNTAFLQHKQCVFLGSLLQKIPRRLLPLAVATHKAKSLIYQPWDSEYDDANRAAVGRLLEQAFSRLSAHSLLPSAPPLTPLDMLSLDKTHSIIHYFTTDFISTSLSVYKAIFSSIPISHRLDTPTADELERIYRAFYRFELYTPTPIFTPWSPWANDQLLCVYKYLDGKLHFGLSFVYKLLHAQDYASRKRIIDRTNFSYVGGRVDDIRLPDLIARSSSHLPPDIPLTPGLFLPRSEPSTYSPLSNLYPRTTWPGIDDPDSLPVYLWLVAHYPFQAGGRVYFGKELLRDAGNVFWKAGEKMLVLLPREFWR
ncbi:hypothetical protein GE09DRAFT_1291328 [Coniochaeta sp. 2T2.1]|nr:hypothetical protein GE09DRAFT_1291328 [Coniochaeta sp. 2T2.1]